MVKELKYGQIMLNIKVNIKMEKRMARVYQIFLMDQNMKENSKIMKQMELEPIFGQIKEYIKDNGKKIKCMGRDKFLGLMEENIQEYLNLILKKKKEYIEDRKHGKGIFEWGDGRKYEGTWVNGIILINYLNLR